MPKGGQLGQAYLDKNLPEVEERLKMAGVRLAAVFNGEYRPPAGSAAATQPGSEADSDVMFVGSTNSEVYHYPGCADVQTIKPENLVKYKSGPAGKRLQT